MYAMVVAVVTGVVRSAKVCSTVTAGKSCRGAGVAVKLMTGAWEAEGTGYVWASDVVGVAVTG